MVKRALVIAGGGFRNSYSSGVVSNLCFPENVFDSINVCSSAIIPGISVLTGQYEDARKGWIERSTNGQVFDGKKFNIDYLVDELICSNLDLGKIHESKTDLMVSIFDVEDAETHYRKINDENYKRLFKATISLPYYSDPRLFENGRLYADGGTYEWLPLRLPIEQEYDKILILLNEPTLNAPKESSMMAIRKSIRSYFAFPNNKKARKVFRQRDTYAEQFLDMLEDTDRFMVIHPENNLPADKLVDNKELIAENYNIGLEDGRENRLYVKGFLELD